MVGEETLCGYTTTKPLGLNIYHIIILEYYFFLFKSLLHFQILLPKIWAIIVTAVTIEVFLIMMTRSYKGVPSIDYAHQLFSKGWGLKFNYSPNETFTVCKAEDFFSDVKLRQSQFSEIRYVLVQKPEKDRYQLTHSHHHNQFIFLLTGPPRLAIAILRASQL